MFTSPKSFRRMLAYTTAVSMLLPSFPLPAAAQDDAEAPPARVGQIAALNGSVSFNGPGTGGWAAASLNYPVSSGDSLYTQDGAQAAIELDSSRITLAADTELQITQLDQNNFAATESQGEAFFAINYLQPGQVFTVSTPGGTVSISQNGQYDVTAGDASNPPVVTVFQGAASAAGTEVAAGQAEALSNPPQQAQARPDEFAQSLLAQTAAPPPSYAPPVVSQMTGSYELSRYGSWNQSPQYGAMWYPQVSSGWAPYREGHWVNVAPWGWTWVENEPWGFAPFHYGRWVDIDDRWGWAPAPAYEAQASYQPIYAPAVVSFFGVALAAGITAAALSSGSIGWVPLAPEEPYYPTYRCPPDYVRRINVVNVRNINIVNVHVTNNYYGGQYRPDQFANRRAATYIPAEAMSRGESVAHYGHAVPQTMLVSARPVDPGFSGHASQQGGPPAYRLPPPGAPLAHQRPGQAPRPVAFAPPHNQPRPLGMEMPGKPPGGHADFNNNPAYHAPPPPPAHGEILKPLPPAGNFHPQEEPHPHGQQFHPQEPQVYHPQAQQFHPQEPQVYHPQEQPHPQAQQFHPQEPQVYHPQEEPHPQAQQFHPQEPQVYHPQEQPRPMEPPHQMEQPHPQPQVFHPQEQPRPMEPPHHVEQPHAQPAHSEQHP